MRKQLTILPEKSILFHWHGIDAHNQKIQGTMLSTHRILVKNELLKQGLRNLRIHRKFFQKKLSLLRPNKKLTEKHILQIMYQLLTLLQSNIPLLQALECMMQHTTERVLCRMLQKIMHSIAAGNTFSEAMQAYTMVFPPYCIHWITIGEKTGNLSAVCQAIVTNMENIHQFKKKLTQALFYPCLLFIVSCGIMMLLLLFVIPQFEQIFSSFHMQTPLMTQAIIQLSHYFQNISHYQIAGIGVTLGVLLRIPMHIKHNHTQIATVFTYIPWVRQIIIHYSLTRFFQTLNITYRFGIPLHDGLHCSIDALLIAQQKRAMQSACAMMHQGESMMTAFTSFRWPLPMTLPILDTAQSTGKLDTILEYLSQCYSEQTDHLMEIAYHLLEPLLMIILGLIIGGIVVGLYLPLFQLGMHF